MALIDPCSSEQTVTVQCDLLGVNRSGLNYTTRTPSEREVWTKHRIDRVYTQYPFYGSRRIAAVINSEYHSGFGDYPACRNTISRYMREMGLHGICPGPNLSKRALIAARRPYLLKGLSTTHPNHVWGIDITYIRLFHGWMYLVVLPDWF